MKLGLNCRRCIVRVLVAAVGIVAVAQLLTRHHTTWPSVRPHKKSSPGLFDCRTVCPPVFWSAWSECSQRCGGGEQRRHRLFEAVCTREEVGLHASPCLQHAKMQKRPCNQQPCVVNMGIYGGSVSAVAAADMLAPFSTDSAAANGRPPPPPNPLNPPIWVDASDHSCALWVNEYKKTFTAVTTGQRSPSYLVYSTAGADYPGGLAGRIRGITTIFILAVLLDRAILLDWQDPPLLSDYLMPNTIDWDTPLQHVQLPPTTAFHDIGSWRAVVMEGKNATWYRTTDFMRLLTQPVEVIRAPVYDFTHALLSNPHLMAKAYALQLDVTRCHLCCTWASLFKFKEEFELQMDERLAEFGATFERLVAMQIRSEAIPSKEEANKLMKCAGKAARNLSNFHFTVASNNKLVIHLLHAHSGYDGLFVQAEDSLDGLVHIHMGTRKLPSHDKEMAVKVQRVTFQHFYLLLKAAVLVRGVGHKASLGVVVDALRRHIDTRLQSYVISGSRCTPIAAGYQGPLF